jgi:hypothetical protein
MKEQDISDRKSTEWILDLAFMVDNLKRLNLSCQGKNTLITSICDKVKALQTKLWLWKCQLKNGNLVHFKICDSVFVQSELQQLLIND